MAMSTVTKLNVSDRLEQRTVQVVECTIPADMTLDEWRRRRPQVPYRRRRRRRTVTPAGTRHLTLVPGTPAEPEPLAA